MLRLVAPWCRPAQGGQAQWAELAGRRDAATMAIPTSLLAAPSTGQLKERVPRVLPHLPQARLPAQGEAPGGDGLNSPACFFRGRLGRGPQLCCLCRGEGNCWLMSQQPNPDQRRGDQTLCPTSALGRTALLTTQPCGWQSPQSPPRASQESPHQPSCSLPDHPSRAVGCCGDCRLLQHQR